VGRRISESKTSQRKATETTSGGSSITEQLNDLKQLFDSLPTMVAKIGHDHKYIYANQAYAELFGNSFRELEGRHLRDVVGDAGYELFLKELNNAGSSEQHKFEQLVELDGESRFFRYTLTPELDVGGKARSYLMLVADATDEFRTQQALRSSEERYRAFIGQSSEGIWRFELEQPISIKLPVPEQIRLSYEYGYLAECNDAMARQYGFPAAASLIGARLGDLLVREDPSNVEFLTSFIESGYRLDDAESHERDADGNDRYFHNNFVGIVEDGHLVRAWGTQRDVTDIKSEELAHERLAAIVASTEDAIISVDLNRNITSWNAAAEQIYGYTAAETIGERMALLIPTDRAEEEDLIFSRIRSGEKVEHFETVRLRKDGKTIDVSLTISPIRDRKGNLVGISKITRDISERKATERELYENRLMLSMAMQSSSMGVWENDLATGIVTWSEELEAIFGLEKGSFQGSEQHYYQLMHEDDRQGVWHEVQRATKEKRPYNIEFRFYHADGSIRWMEGRGEAVYSERGEPVRLYGIGIDVTARKSAEEKVRETEERFRMALSSGAVTVYEQDIDLRYEWVYPTSLYSPDVIGKTDSELVGNDHANKLTDLKRRVIETGNPVREEIAAEVLGEKRWYDLSIEPRFDDNDNIIGIGGTALDISSRKNVESELKRQALLLEAALEPVIVWEFGGRILDWNRGAERLYGYTSQEAIGHVTHELLKTRFHAPFDEIQGILKRDGSWMGELRHTTRNGDEIVVESRHQLIEIDDNTFVLEANRDVTEKRRVTDELRRSEERLQAMFDSTTVGFAVLDPRGRFLQINDAFCSITGYTRTELLGMDDGTLTHSQDISRMDEGLRRLMSGNIQHFTIEKRFIRKDSSLVWVQNSVSMTRDEAGRPLHLISITQDVTARKQAELELELLSRLPMENPHPVFRLAPSGEILYSNQPAEPIIRSLKELDESAFANVLSSVRSAFSTGVKIELEISHDQRVFHLTIAPIVDAGYVNVYGTDITEAKTALIALQESEQRFSRFMQQLPGLAWIKDKHGRYVYVNDSAERSFGIKRSELYGKSDEEVFPAETAKLFKDHDRLALESGTGKQFLESMVESDGKLHYSIVSKFPISDPLGTPALIGGMAIDVTDQKEAEEELRRQVEFDEAVVNSMGEGLLTTDAKGLVTSVNPAAERLFGWSFEELQGKRLHDIAHYKRRDGSLYPPEECEVLTALRTGQALINQDEVFINKDGKFFDVLFSSSPLKENGETTGLVIVFQDISERKTAEIQLERYRHLSEHASDIIWLLKDDGTIVEANQAAIDTYGYSREELIGMNVENLRHPSQIESLATQIASARRGNATFETVHMRKDGSPLSVEVNATSSEFGNERLIMSILRDITSRKRDEKDREFVLKLAESIRTESAPGALLKEITTMLGEHLKLDRCFFSAVDVESRTSTLLTEYRSEPSPALIETVSFDDYSSENLEAALNGETIVVADTAADSRTSSKFEVSYGPELIRSYVAVPQTRDGVWSGILFASRANPYEWDNAEVSLIQTVAERVWLAVEKLRSEAALRESERRAMEEYQRLLERIVPLAETLGAARDLRTIYRSLQEFICASMECSGFFVSFYDNDRQVREAAYIWGEGDEVDISELPPMPVHIGGGPNSRAILGKQTIITNNYWNDQRKRPHIVLKENGIDPMSSIVVPMVVQDRVIGTLEVQAHSNEAFDREHGIALEMASNLSAVAIENVRLIETEARARAEAETANRMKDEFLSVLSHELRTPLNAMLGWVRILRSGNVDPDRAVKALEIIERNTRQQSSLIEDLLDVSRIISGKMRIETELIDFVPAMEQAAENVRPLAVAKGVEFEVKTAGEPLYLNGDVVRLQQVITNLLQNAIKFTSSGGKVELDWRRGTDSVEIDVTDTGIGIEKDFLPMIFDRFSQADASTRRNNTGLGLGLTIVSTIVEMHGGSTSVFSDGPGSGSKFTVTLPLAQQYYSSELPSYEPVASNGEANSLAGIRVLVVDDDADGLTPLRLLLENEQAEVTCALSASEALSELRSKDFDILISDIGMPSMDGLELISELRSGGMSRNSQIKAIAYTAYASQDDKNSIINSGYQVHLAKPLEMDELLAIVGTFSSDIKQARVK